MSLSIPGIVLFNAVWIKGGTCLGRMPFGWASPSLEAWVTCRPPALPRASQRGSWDSFTWPWLLLIRDHLNAAGPSPCPLGSSRRTKTHQTAKCKKHFQPCKERRAGKENTALLCPPCFSEAFVFLEVSTFLTLCVLLRRFWSFSHGPD